MNGFDRMEMAFLHKEADRVPIAEVEIDINVIKKIYPKAEFQSDFEEAFDFDCVMTYDHYKTIWKEGRYIKDEWGITYQLNGEETPHPVMGPLQEEDCFDLTRFSVPDVKATERLGRVPELVKKYKGTKYIGMWMRAFFLWATHIVGFENLLMYMHTEPSFVKELFDKILEGQIKLAEIAIEAGVDMIVETDDYAYNRGPFISMDMFDTFITPRMKKFNEAVHAKGAKLVKHTDGMIMELLPKFIECGADGHQSIDPIAGMDLAIVKEKFGDKLTLWGNIDCANLMCFGTPDMVDAAVSQCMKAAAKGGGYIFGTCNSIVRDTKPENYLRMIKCAKKYGKYPIL